MLRQIAHLLAGPIYELWAITSNWHPYKRLGMSDQAPSGTAWERVPDILLYDVSLGIYGPMGLYYTTRELIILNGWYIFNYKYWDTYILRYPHFQQNN
jgi:hypothetical protein